MKDFDCNVCQAKALHSEGQGRTCFLYDVHENKQRGHREDGDHFRVPRLNVDGTLMKTHGINGEVIADVVLLHEDTFLDTLVHLNDRLPELSGWQIHQTYFREVCLTALGDAVLSSIIMAQGSCERYRLDITNEDIREAVLGFYMTLPDLLEAFDIIVAARNSYERYEMERIEKEAERKRNKK